MEFMTKKNRRQFVKGLTFSYLSLIVSPYIIGLDSRIFASTTDSNNKDIHKSPEAIGSADLGPLNAPDKNGVMLPDGLEARLIAKSGKELNHGYFWHGSPDGAGVFSSEDGGWVYVSNSELPDSQGGVGALKFNKNGKLIDAYSLLTGSERNCSGGTTPWGTWLSGEEYSRGLIWEVSPKRGDTNYPKKRPELGVFIHEAAVVDPENNYIYMTNDEPAGLFYRFIPGGEPRTESFYSRGNLQAAKVEKNNIVSWINVPDPYAKDSPIIGQLPEATSFERGEGMTFFEGNVFFATTKDHRLWFYNTKYNELSLFYDGLRSKEKITAIDWLKSWKKDTKNKILNDPDDMTVTKDGQILVAEDSDNMELCLLGKDGSARPLLRLDGHWFSEVTGPAFSPDGSYLYFSSQRGISGSRLKGGMTFEVRRKV